MMKYELWDLYEADLHENMYEGGELICASDSIPEIKMAAKRHEEDTDGECLLYVRAWLSYIHEFHS